MTRLSNVLYNLDRLVASAFGAPRQSTISAEVGRIERGEAKGHNRFETWAALRLAGWLDTTPKLWGPDHTERAEEAAETLENADDTNISKGW